MSSEQHAIGGHLFAVTNPNQAARIVISPENAQVPQHAEDYGRYEALKQGSQLIPPNPTPFNGRVPLPYEPQGYVHIFPRDGGGSSGIGSVAGAPGISGMGGSEGFAPSATASARAGPGSIGPLAGSLTDEFGLPIGEEILMADQGPKAPFGDFFSDAAFQELTEGFKGMDGKFLAMTAYGAVPLPDQMLKSIPEKLMSRPVVQERDIFVLKQEERTRVCERDYTQFEHLFVDVPKALVVDKIELQKQVRVIEIPHFNYKPVFEDKIVEIPLGIKYVEIPIEVACRMPPRIVPVPKPHIVERVIETTKPVVQEKIIEVPEIVRKKVPKVVIKDIPYVVPKYVEKIIEVPYQPGQTLPAPKGAPMTTLPQPPPLPDTAQGEVSAPTPIQSRFGYADSGASSLDTGRYPPGQFGPGGGLQIGPGGQFMPGAPGSIAGSARAPSSGSVYPPGGYPPGGYPPGGYTGAPSPRAYVKDDTLVVEGGPAEGPQTFYLTQGIRNVQLPYEAKIEVSVVQQDEVPRGAPIAQRDVRYMAPGTKAMAYNEPGADFSSVTSPDEPVYAGPMDPVIAHAAPGMRAIEFRTRGAEPDILTQQGVMKYSKFECCLQKDVNKVLPNLPHHALVPMDPPGTPNLKSLAFVHQQHAARISSRGSGGSETQNE